MKSALGLVVPVHSSQTHDPDGGYFPTIALSVKGPCHKEVDVQQTIKKAGAAVVVSVIATGVSLLGSVASSAGGLPKVDLAATVCRGIAGCTPVVSGWIAVPGGTVSSPGRAEAIVACRGKEIAVNFGATGPSDSTFDVVVDAVIAILNGVPHARTFEAENTAGASTFQAAVGCTDIASASTSGPRNAISSASSAEALSPGQTKDFSVSCPDGHVAFDGEADVTFNTAEPPPTSQLDDVSFSFKEHRPELTVVVRTDRGLSPADHAELQLRTDCQTGS
jgi:hypothetical protein